VLSDTAQTPADCVDQYLQHLANQRGLASTTVQAYAEDLDLLLALGPQTSDAHGWPDAALIRKWIAQVARQGAAPRSIARRLSAWRGFFDWLIAFSGAANRPSANPLKGLRGPKAARLLPKALSPDKASALLESDQSAALADQAFINARNQAVLELLYSSGLRLSELVSLDVWYHEQPASLSWLEMDQGQVQVLGKGSKRRIVPVGSKALDALARWLLVRQERLAQLNAAKLHSTQPDSLQPDTAHQADNTRNAPDARALFISQHGRRLSARSVQVWAQREAQARGLDVRLHPHVMRHSMATHVLQSSGDLRAVQELLGHANISTTQVYTALDFQHLALVYDKAHPRAKTRSSS
jgi:integrase/recombinase XerC